MKIAKLSVTTKTIDDVVANIVVKVPSKELKVTLNSIKEKILEKLAKLNVGPKGAPKRYVLAGYSNMELLAENDPRVDDCFVVFDSKSALEAQFNIKTNKNIWARYKFPNPISPETQLRYESFFSGFLHYYDTELRNGLSDHAMYCRWQKKANQDVVTVYLDPAPLRHKLKPMPGAKPVTKTADDYVRLMAKKNKEMRSTIFNPTWAPPGGVDGFQSDPPSPQGPPPPEVVT